MTGKATVDVVVPNGQTPGPMTLTLVGAETGSESQVTVNVVSGSSSVAANDTSVVYGQAAPIQVTVTGPGATPSGTVHLKNGATEITSGVLDASGNVTLTVPARTFDVGQVTLTAAYDGDATHDPSTDTLTLTTTKAASSLTVPNATVEFGNAVPVTVTVNTPAGVVATGTVTVKNGATTLGTGTVSGGSATITLPAASVPAGTATLTASYSRQRQRQRLRRDLLPDGHQGRARLPRPR